MRNPPSTLALVTIQRAAAVAAALALATLREAGPGFWLMSLLLAATSRAVAALSGWLLPVYWAAMAWLMLEPLRAWLGRMDQIWRTALVSALERSRAASTAADAIPEAASAPPVDHPAEEPSASGMGDDTGVSAAEPAATAAVATATKRRTTRGRGSRRDRPPAVPAPLEVTWVRVGPGQFVRLEAPPALTPEPTPDADDAPRPDPAPADVPTGTQAEARADETQPPAPVDPVDATAPRTIDPETVEAGEFPLGGPAGDWAEIATIWACTATVTHAEAPLPPLWSGLGSPGTPAPCGDDPTGPAHVHTPIAPSPVGLMARGTEPEETPLATAPDALAALRCNDLPQTDDAPPDDPEPSGLAPVDSTVAHADAPPEFDGESPDVSERAAPRPGPARHRAARPPGAWGRPLRRHPPRRRTPRPWASGRRRGRAGRSRAPRSTRRGRDHIPRAPPRPGAA